MPTYKQALVEFSPGRIVWHPLPDNLDSRLALPGGGGPPFLGFIGTLANVVTGVATIFALSEFDGRQADRHAQVMDAVSRAQASTEWSRAVDELSARIDRFRTSLGVDQRAEIAGSRYGISLKEVQKTVDQFEVDKASITETCSLRENVQWSS